MKKKIILMSVAGAMMLTLIIGGTMAGFTAQSEAGTADISTKQLGITLEDGNVPMANAMEEIEIAMPGDEIPVPYRVTNDVADGYDLYTRVTIYKYWEDRSLDAKNIQIYVGSGEDKVELKAGTNVDGWIVWYEDEEQVIAYYTRPLAAGESTSDILDTLTVSKEISNSYTGQTVKLEIEADAVQKAVAESSIPAEWGVYPKFDSNGTITAIAE